jgi:hypothetical protein
MMSVQSGMTAEDSLFDEDLHLLNFAANEFDRDNIVDSLVTAKGLKNRRTYKKISDLVSVESERLNKNKSLS